MKWLLLFCLIGIVACQTAENPQEKGILEWISGLFGDSTTSSPINDPPVTEPKECPACQCGIMRTRRRIVGGSETKVNEFPWIVALMYNGNRFYCGGSLLNDLYVITASHCTAGFRKERIVVRLLEHDRSQKNETKTIDIKVAEIIRHQQYNPSNYDNDIALLKLAKRLDLSSALKRLRDDSNSTDDEQNETGVRPVCLPDKGFSYTNYTGKVIGWGTTDEGGSVSNTLQEVSVPILSNDDCRKTKYKERITDNMLCAGLSDGGKDACQGDSGGPLFVESPNKKYQLVGVVSWGEGCARPDRPGVYSRVNRYMTWLKSNTKDACYCD